MLYFRLGWGKFPKTLRFPPFKLLNLWPIIPSSSSLFGRKLRHVVVHHPCCCCLMSNYSELFHYSAAHPDAPPPKNVSIKNFINYVGDSSSSRARENKIFVKRDVNYKVQAVSAIMEAIWRVGCAAVCGCESLITFHANANDMWGKSSASQFNERSRPRSTFSLLHPLCSSKRVRNLIITERVSLRGEKGERIIK